MGRKEDRKRARRLARVSPRSVVDRDPNKWRGPLNTRFKAIAAWTVIAALSPTLLFLGWSPGHEGPTLFERWFVAWLGVAVLWLIPLLYDFEVDPLRVRFAPRARAALAGLYVAAMPAFSLLLFAGWTQLEQVQISAQLVETTAERRDTWSVTRTRSSGSKDRKVEWEEDVWVSGYEFDAGGQVQRFERDGQEETVVVAYLPGHPEFFRAPGVSQLPGGGAVLGWLVGAFFSLAFGGQWVSTALKGEPVFDIPEPLAP